MAGPDIEHAAATVRELLDGVDDVVNELSWHCELNGTPLARTTVAGYRKSLRDYLLGELVAGRVGCCETTEGPRAPF